MADVTLTYKGNTILSLSSSATKTIKTGGKFCEGDIGISYVKPSSSSGVSKSGSIITLNSNLIVNIQPHQSGSGDPSASNIRPLSGWTECNVFVTGKNLFDATTVVDSRYINSAGEVKSMANYFATTYINVRPNTTYRISKLVNSNVDRYIAFYSDNNVASFITPSLKVRTTSITFTTPDNCYYMRFCGAISLKDSIMLTISDAAQEEYESYHGNIYPISFPAEAGTVYAGTLTINDGTGELKAQPYYASYNGETLVGPWISDRDVYAAGITPTIGAQVIDLGGDETVYQLALTQVMALIGANNIWTDCGDLSFTCN